MSEEASDQLRRANILLEIIASASRDPRAKDFRFLGSFLDNRDEKKPRVKGFHNTEEGVEYFKTKGIEEEWYLIFDLGNPNVIQMC